MASAGTTRRHSFRAEDHENRSAKKTETAISENRQDHERPGHDERRFVADLASALRGLPKKNDDEEARYVKRGQKRGEKREREDRHVALIGEREDRVLAEESAERRAPDQRERADGKGQKCDGKITGKPTHLPNVLLVMEHDDDGTGAEEEERFEKGVREEMEHGRFV